MRIQIKCELLYWYIEKGYRPTDNDPYVCDAFEETHQAKTRSTILESLVQYSPIILFIRSFSLLCDFLKRTFLQFEAWSKRINCAISE